MMIVRAAFAIVLALGLLAWPLAADAQQTKRIPRIGVLGGQSPETSPPILALRQGLKDLGYVEGQTIAVEWRWAHGETGRFDPLASELVKLKVDVIVAGSIVSAQAAQRATRTIPIVMGFGSDPVELGLVASLARPGGNITGLAVPNAEIAGKRVQLLRELVPTATRIAVLGDSGNQNNPAYLRGTEAAAKALGMQHQVWKLRGDGDLDEAFAAIAKTRAAGIVTLPSLVLNANRPHLVRLATKYRLPTVTGSRAFTDAGCLMSYGVSAPDLARRAAYFVDKILKGATPGDLPVEQPTKFDFVINLKTAKALGLTIPPSLLLRADQVIE